VEACGAPGLYGPQILQGQRQLAGVVVVTLLAQRLAEAGSDAYASLAVQMSGFVIWPTSSTVALRRT
jgi:hypothetical protein